MDASNINSPTGTTLAPAREPTARVIPRITAFQSALASSRRLLYAITLILIGLLALALFLYHTSSVSLWYDEIYSLELSSLPLSLFWKAHQSNMVLYYILLYGWLKVLHLVGVAPTALWGRLPSIVTMALAAVLVTSMGIRFWRFQTGVVAGLLFCLNELVLSEAQQARGYPLQILSVCLAWNVLLFALKEPRAKRWWFMYAAASIFAIYAQVLSVFIVMAQAMGVMALLLPPIARHADDFPEIRQYGWRAYIMPGGISLLSIVAATILLILDSGKHHGYIGWVPVATPSAIWGYFLAQTANSAFFATALLFAIALGAILGLMTRRGLPLLLVIWGVIPVAIQYALSLPYPNLHFFLPRYLMASIPAFVLLAAIGVTAVRPRWLAVGATLALLLLMTRVPVAYYPTPELQPFAETTNWMEARYQPGDGVICRPDAKQCGIPISYYLDYAYSGPTKMPTTFPGNYDWGRFRSTPTDKTTLTTYLQSHPRVFVFTVAPIGGNPQSVNDDVPETLVANGYRLVAVCRLATNGHAGDVEVDEYVRT